ncbi:hypothetical protein G7K_2606-t1 [Saitoella complicata NRRL Y-17804]|uniref:Uncharacterized protein n=1 Tax=Saitoella complicata (strain BCRC 22490 / CBS 7301 / JCM 7358 / NBRC 10748 / NRRL Y-17804) TaxID=698492 RepID=A0A0E9NF49_SAICN|nr:hypothetical protein G7K_2606-t1 [Saitoella complicata NRRL Y-17804]
MCAMLWVDEPPIVESILIVLLLHVTILPIAHMFHLDPPSIFRGSNALFRHVCLMGIRYVPRFTAIMQIRSKGTNQIAHHHSKSSSHRCKPPPPQALQRSTAPRSLDTIHWV